MALPSFPSSVSFSGSLGSSEVLCHCRSFFLQYFLVGIRIQFNRLTRYSIYILCYVVLKNIVLTLAEKSNKIQFVKTVKITERVKTKLMWAHLSFLFILKTKYLKVFSDFHGEEDQLLKLVGVIHQHPVHAITLRP